MDDAELQILKKLRDFQRAGMIDVVIKAPGHQAIDQFEQEVASRPRHKTLREVADDVDSLTANLPESDRTSTLQLKKRWRSPTNPGSTPEPPPIKTDTPAVWDLVLADMAERDRFGEAKYSVRLQPHNGRNFLRDFYQELLDGVVYLRGEIYEREGK